MDISSALAGIKAIQKLLPVIEEIGKEIGPILETEVKDGKVVWSDLLQCYDDFKGAVEAVYKAAETPAEPPPPAA